MASSYGTAGSKLFIGTTKAATDAVSYGTDTWTQIKGVEDFGEFGDKAETIKVSIVEDARIHKLKGARDAGDMQVVVAFDALDAGQTAARVAATTSYAYNIKVVPNDAPPGGTPSTYFFKAMVNGSSLKLGGNSNEMKQTFEFEITSEITPVPATASA